MRMIRRSDLRRISTLLVGMIATPLGWGLDGNAVMTLAVDAFVNQQPASPGLSLKPGDQVQTSPSGIVSLTLPNGKVDFGQKTLVRVENGALRLTRGYVHVTGSIVVIEGTHRAIPATPDTEYDLLQLANGRAFAHVFNGELSLTGFARPFKVEPGSAVTFVQHQIAQQDLTQNTEAIDEAGSGSATTGRHTETSPAGASLLGHSSQQTPDNQQAGTADTAAANPDQAGQQDQGQPQTPQGQGQQTQTQTQQTQTTTTPPGGETQTQTTTTVEEEQPKKKKKGGAVYAGATEVPLVVAIGLMAAAALITGIIVYEVTRPSHSPTQ